MSKYLNELLRSFVDKILSTTTTFRGEPDFMYQLYDHIFTKHELQSTTLFYAIKITNYYTLNTHKNMIDIVGYFLEDNLVPNKLEQATIQNIKNLLHIFLYNNVFYYKDQIYALTKDSPNTMPLSDTLSNIYVFVWQKQILKQLQLNNEFFGRYKDQIFFTWNNGNEEKLGSFLQAIRDKSPNVQFQKLIASSVPFLNAFVQNQNGKLFSRIYRHPLIQGYSLPYEVGHAKLAHSDWLRSVLIRAVCYCSCLTNGYSLRFVEAHVQHFFNFFHLHPMRYSRDQIMYNKFRHNWFNYIKIQHELSDQLQQFDDKASKTTEFTIDTKHHYYATTINSVIGSNRTFTASARDAILVDKIAFNDEFSVKQDNNDQQQLSSIQSYSSSNDTPTKISTLTKKEDIIHSQEVQAADDMPPLASLLSCFVRIERCQVDKDIYIPGKNLEGNHELQEQATEKEQHKTTLSVETKGTLSLYDADPYLEDNNSMNNMMIIGSPLSQPLNFDTME
ncbi:unnamed protein product [Rotaria socialis]|uniref:Uncharacterized protein n=1 Tax=Rotaria socialis TaxID=392032 RepID=A0A821DES6_9BILA|nr:unnamed protein product [Rotaria socialis]